MPDPSLIFPDLFPNPIWFRTHLSPRSRDELPSKPIPLSPETSPLAIVGACLRLTRTSPVSNTRLIGTVGSGTTIPPFQYSLVASYMIFGVWFFTPLRRSNSPSIRHDPVTSRRGGLVDQCVNDQLSPIYMKGYLPIYMKGHTSTPRTNPQPPLPLLYRWNWRWAPLSSIYMGQ